MTWHVAKDTFPVTEVDERAVIWLCGEVEQGSESFAALVIGPRPLGDMCPGYELLAGEAVTG